MLSCGTQIARPAPSLRRARGRSAALPQEEARRAYDGAMWPKSDFLTAAAGARVAAAAGWCFHTAAGFDLTTETFFDQLDEVELDTLDELAPAVSP